jgi:putative membrane protein
MARLIYISIFTLVLLWSGLQPKDQFTWFLEVLPALIGAVVLFKSYKTFPLTPLLYILILLHSIVLMIGGHYTYAEVPFFENLWGTERNNYDKVGHFFQGFVPALIARELLLRFQVVLKKGWLNIIIIAICLAISAFYELIEWWVALATGEGAEAFLGTQGYVWDTQSDMAWALIGAVTSVIVLARWHDQQLNRLMR